MGAYSPEEDFSDPADGGLNPKLITTYKRATSFMYNKNMKNYANDLEKMWDSYFQDQKPVQL